MKPSSPEPIPSTTSSHLNRRQFLQGAALSLAGAALGGAGCRAPGGAGAPGTSAAAAPVMPAPAEGTASFFLVGDTHYCADEVETSAMRARSVDVTGRLVGWLNELPGTAVPAEAGGGAVARPHGVIHAGDIVDNGDKGPRCYPMAETEMKAFIADWGLNGGDGRLKWAVREVHGNHDSPRGDGPVIPELKARNRRRKELKAVSKNGLHYSWDWAGVHFVALGIVVGDSPKVSRVRRYAPMGSLPFLEADLAENVGRSGRPVVLVHHVDAARYAAVVEDEVAVKNEWDYGDVQAFYEVLKPYRVAACLYGHTHVRNLFRWDGTRNQRAVAGIPSINTDNASHYGDLRQAFLHLEVDAKELRVREFATVDAWRTGAWTPQVWRFELPRLG